MGPEKLPIHRRYRIVEYNSHNTRYLQLIVQFTDAEGVWRTHAVRSYGQVTSEGQAQAEKDLALVQQYCSEPTDPIPHTQSWHKPTEKDWWPTRD